MCNRCSLKSLPIEQSVDFMNSFLECSFRLDLMVSPQPLLRALKGSVASPVQHITLVFPLQHAPGIGHLLHHPDS